MTLPILLHCHVPDAGGAGLDARVLVPFAGERRIFRLCGPAFETVARLPRLHVARAMRCHAATGHVPHGYLSQVYPNAVHVSVFCDPVDRMLNFLNRVLASPEHPAHTRLAPEIAARAAEDPELLVDAVLSDPALAAAQANVQTRLAAGCARFGTGAVGDMHLKAAYMNIAAATYRVAERAGLARLVADLQTDWPIRRAAEMPAQSPPMQDRARGAVLSRQMLSPRLTARLEDANALDLHLLEAVMRRTASLAAAA